MRCLIFILISAVVSGTSTEKTAPVTDDVRKAFRVKDKIFYKKHYSYKGLAILSSAKVPDAAHREAAYVIKNMLNGREDILKMIIKNGIHLGIMNHDEFTTDIPEHATLKEASYWDRRARGLGATWHRPVVTCGVENLLNYKGDPYRGGSILVHEFAHVIHQFGLNYLDKNFDKNLKAIYKRALKKGLWKKTYASGNHVEYFAETLMCYFNCNFENDALHNHVNTRKELKEYDPEIYQLFKKHFKEWTYIPPYKRKNSEHLKGYSFSKAPTFQWPKYLQRLHKKKLTAPLNDSRYNSIRIDKYMPENNKAK